jgi:hypothetical protein
MTGMTFLFIKRSFYASVVWIPRAVIEPSVDKHWELRSIPRYSQTSRGNVHILHAMFHYHCRLIFWRFWKVSLIDTEIVDILHKVMKTVLGCNKEFWREGRAASWIKFCIDLRMTPILARAWVCKYCFKDFRLSFP